MVLLYNDILKIIMIINNQYNIVNNYSIPNIQNILVVIQRWHSYG